MSKGKQLTQPKQDDHAAFMAALRKVDDANPKPEDITNLRRLLKSNDTNWQVAGDLMQQAQHTALRTLNMGKGKTVTVESAEEGMQYIRRQLGYASAPMLEKLLIEQIVTAWLRLGICEMQFSALMAGAVAFDKGDYWNRVLDAAQRRYLRAIESLARVRRLKLPALQVNVAQAGAKQLNLAASVNEQAE